MFHQNNPFFSRVIMKLLLFSKRIMSLGKFFSSFHFSFFPLVSTKVSLEDINFVIVQEMAETLLVPNLPIKKELKIANYSQPKSLLKLISSSYCLENLISICPIFLSFILSPFLRFCNGNKLLDAYGWFRLLLIQGKNLIHLICG